MLLSSTQTNIKRVLFLKSNCHIVVYCFSDKRNSILMPDYKAIDLLRIDSYTYVNWSSVERFSFVIVLLIFVCYDKINIFLSIYQFVSFIYSH